MNKQLNTLTIARFFAAFMVLGYHFFSFPKDYNFLNQFFSKGSLGVDFFFILSGFVLGLRYSHDFKNNTLNRNFNLINSS